MMVRKACYFKQDFDSIQFWKHSQPCILSSPYAYKMMSLADPINIVNNKKTKQGIEKIQVKVCIIK